MHYHKNDYTISDAQLNSQSDPPQSNDFFCTIRQISVDIGIHKILQISYNTFLLDRTFPNHQMFKPGSTNQYSLFRILAAYSEYNKTVGYCQGNSYHDNHRYVALQRDGVHCCCNVNEH